MSFLNVANSKALMAVIGVTSALVMLGAPVFGADIFSNPIDGTDVHTFNPFTSGQFIDSNLTVSGIGRGDGIGPNTASNRYNARNWAPGFDETDYFTWTLTPNSGFEIDFSSLMGVWRRSGTGPSQYALRTSVDGFSADVSSGTIEGSASDVDYVIDLSSIQDIATSIEFRLFAWGGNNVAGTFSINDFVFDGAVVATSTDPTTLAGDYNGDNIVDAADYTVWQDKFGAFESLPNETLSLGVVDNEDYEAWKSNYGTAAGAGEVAISGLTVPEPASYVICLFAAACVRASCRGRRQRT